MKIALLETPLDPWQAVEAYQRELDAAGKFGATSVFVGTMRDFNEGEAVQAMTLEYYPGMTERHLEQISADAAQRWEILDSLIVHRVGTIAPADPIVVVAVWAAHRAAAFDACRFLMEELKSRAPFWKKESLAEGERWVEHNTPG